MSDKIYSDIQEVLESLILLREQNEISSASYNISLYLLRELTKEVKPLSQAGRRPHPGSRVHKLNYELARAGTLHQLSEVNK
jgi:hypothetical protein